MFDWHSEFPRIFSGDKPGFDVVIGNPPYVLLQDEFRDDRQLAYFRDRYRVASYKVDTYHLFIERALQLTRSGGVFGLITPTNYLTNNYLSQLRALLLDGSAIDSITVIDGAVFPRRSVDCAVIAARPHSRTEKPFPVLRAQLGPHQSLVISGNLKVTPDRVRSSQHFLFTGTAQGELGSILDRMESTGMKLGEIAQISFGKQLRDRRKYPGDVLDVGQRRGGIPEGYVRCYTGVDVRRWSVNWSGLALLDKEEARPGGCWDSKIQRARSKLITRQIGRYPTWGIDEVGYQCLNTVFMVMLTASTVDPHYALGVLNSAPLRSYWLDRFYDQRTTFPKIKGTYLKRLPLPPATEDAQRTIRSHVDSLIKLVAERDHTSTDAGRRQVERAIAAHERELDERVAMLFGLGSDETEILRLAAGS
jgi:hypothetical protein